MLLEKILNSKKTKYAVLKKTIPNYIPPDAEEVNIFVDVYSVINSLYNPNTIEIFNSLKAHEKTMIAAELLNLAAHWRHYFWSRHSMYTTIFFYYSRTECKPLTDIKSDFKRDFYLKRFDSDNSTFGNLNEIVRKNLKIIRLIGEYIPHFYPVDTGEMEPMAFPYHALDRDIVDGDAMSLILSNDKLAFQNSLLGENTVTMTVKGDKSNIIDEDMVVRELTSEDHARDYTFVPEFLPYILSIAGYKKYNIDGLSGYGFIRASNRIQKWVEEGTLSNMKYEDPETFSDSVSDDLGDRIETVLRNFRLVDIESVHSECWKQSLFQDIDDQIVDKVDAKSLRFINEKYFTRYPIMLEEIVEGEEYE